MSTTIIVSLILFIITYICIFAFEKFRPYVALIAAALFVVLGSGLLPDYSYTIKDAIAEIDWNVLLMISGTMGTVQLFIESNMPSRMSDIIVSKVSSTKWMIVILSLFAGIISAFVDNVATVLMIAPVALALCKKVGISPVSTIICISISSNLQGAATLVGDTTSILLAKAAKLDFSDFFIDNGKIGMFFVTEAGALVASLIILFMFRKENGKIEVSSRTEIKDYIPTVLLGLTVVSLIVVSFIPYADNAAPGGIYKPDITNGLICISFFAVGLIRKCIRNKDVLVVKKAVLEIDFYTLGLLFGLFVVIGGIKKAGIIDLLANGIYDVCGGSSKTAVFITYTVIVWMSVLVSAFIDNIPYVATMLPVVASLAGHFIESGVSMDPKLLYCGLLVGATLGGNLTPVGASANITGIGILRKEGYTVKSKEFMKYSVPFTLSAVLTGYILLWLIWM